MSAPIRSHAAVVNAHLGELDIKDSHIVGAVGLGADGTYSPSLSIPYISSATDVKNAIEIVAQSLRVVETSFAETTYVDQKIADLIGSAPGILDTLGEIATSLAENPNLSATLVSTIAAENVRATAAEGVLRTDLSGEKTRAEDAEQALTSTIAGEAARAIGEELMLSTIIAGEIATARSEEQQLSTLIANEKARAIAQEQYLSTTIHSEILRALAEDDTMDSALAQEILRATTIENVLSTSIVTERLRATGVEETLSTNIATEKSRAVTEELQLTSSITAEVTRATGAESGLSTLIADEKSRAILAEQGLSTGLGSEVTRATGAESGLSTLIAGEKSRAILAEQGLSTGLASETSRAIAAEQSISSGLVVETSRALAAELNLRTDLSGEITRAVAAEQGLSTGLVVETNRALAAELNLRTDLSGEISRATVAEGALRSDISNVKFDYLKRDGTLKMVGSLDMSGNRITNLPLPAALKDATSVDFYQNSMRTMNFSLGTLTPNIWNDASALIPSNLDLVSTAAGNSYRVYGQGNVTAQGAVVYTLAGVTNIAVTANNESEYTRFGYGSLASTGTITDAQIMDLSGAMDGSGSWVTVPHDLTIAANDLKTKYPSFNFFRVPLSATGPYYYTYTNYSNNILSSNTHTHSIRMEAGDILEFAQNIGGVNTYNRIIYRAPINASAGGVHSIDFLNHHNNSLKFSTSTHLFYTRYTSSGTIGANFRVIRAVRAGDIVVRTSSGNQWDIIDCNDPSVNGTRGRISVKGLGPAISDFQVDIANDYVGQTSITTLGNVTNGTWNATTIAATRGGTGFTSYTNGDIIYGMGVSMVKLAIGTNGHIIKSNGTTPSWGINDTASITMTSSINDGGNNLQVTLQNISTSVANETTRAITVENNLSTTIVNQISSVIGAAPQALDTLNEIAIALGNDPNLSATLISTIGAETTRATNAESGLTSTIAGEATRAILAEQGLSTLIADGGSALADEIERATGIESGLSTLIADEKDRAELAEQNLTSTIAGEKSRAEGAEYTLTQNLTNEVSRATGIEQGLSTLIADEKDRALAAELVLTNDLADEVTRATNAEQGLSTSIVQTNADLADEVTRAEAAELVLRTDLSGEKTRAEAAELVLRTDISGEIERAVAAEGVLTQDLADEVTRAEAAELVLRTDISGEKTRAEAAELVLTNDLADEVTRAVAAEGVLTQDLADEVTRAEAAELQLRTDISGEKTRAEAAEDALDGRLDTVESQLTTGTEGQVLKYIDGVAVFATNNSDGVSLSDATNFPSITTLQSALDYLFNFTQTRKIIQHVVTNSADYSNPTTANVNFPTGKVHFINYDSDHLDIFLPPSTQSYPDGTVYRLVHNGNHGDENYIIKYSNGTTSTAIFELAPRDTMSFIWDADSSSYLFGVGL